ncbi:hypothetical protein DFH27DRAFT_555513 [Peziza echinospora]|nr:hypothetical protein DFH27DRAFT_555513 [Peziza echinospora]
MVNTAAAAVLIGSFLPAVMGHIAIWHPSVYGFNGNGYTLVEPLSNLPFNKWWFHGQLDNAPKNQVMQLPAGGQVTIEHACNKEFTSYGKNKNGNNNPCPPDTPSMHAGSPIKEDLLRGCALAIAYKNDAKQVKKEDFVVFSVNTRCVRELRTSYRIPAGMPGCGGGKCICAWFWQGQNSNNEMYMNGFDCNIVNPGNRRIAEPKVPVECSKNPNDCVKGAKQPFYWANQDGNYKMLNIKPEFTRRYGFENGAQEGMFQPETKRRAIRYSSAELEVPEEDSE